LNYIIKDTVQPYLPDLKDNIIFLNVEMDITAIFGEAAIAKK
jgi:hypothetical protein